MQGFAHSGVGGRFVRSPGRARLAVFHWFYIIRGERENVAMPVFLFLMQGIWGFSLFWKSLRARFLSFIQVSVGFGAAHARANRRRKKQGLFDARICSFRCRRPFRAVPWSRSTGSFPLVLLHFGMCEEELRFRFCLFDAAFLIFRALSGIAARADLEFFSDLSGFRSGARARESAQKKTSVAAT